MGRVIAKGIFPLPYQRYMACGMTKATGGISGMILNTAERNEKTMWRFRSYKSKISHVNAK